MRLAEWLAQMPEAAAKAGPGVGLETGMPGSRERPQRYADLIEQRRKQLDATLG